MRIEYQEGKLVSVHVTTPVILSVIGFATMFVTAFM